MEVGTAKILVFGMGRFGDHPSGASIYLCAPSQTHSKMMSKSCLDDPKITPNSFQDDAETMPKWCLLITCIASFLSDTALAPFSVRRPLSHSVQSSSVIVLNMSSALDRASSKMPCQRNSRFRNCIFRESASQKCPLSEIGNSG